MSRRKKRGAPDPYAVGTLHEVRVDRLDAHPAAVAISATGREVRVPGGVPGDVATVRVVARGRRDVWTELVSVQQPSPARVSPPCAIAETCGTCPWQAVGYADQRAAKARLLREALASRPQLAGAEVVGPEGIGVPVGYRTKIQMPAGQTARGLELGFYAPRSHDFVPAPQCVVQHPAGEAARRLLIEVLDRHGVTAYDEATGQGVLRHVLIRVAEGTGEVGAVLVVKDLDAFDWAVLAAELQGRAELTGVWVNENDQPGNAVLGPRTVHLAGARRLRDEVAGRPLLRSPVGFFQTNHRATEQLVALVKRLLPERMGLLLDLYAGGGLFSLMLADRAERLCLVESHHGAVTAARATLHDAGVTHARVIIGRVEEVLPALLAEGEAADAAVIDPPRAGLAEPALAALGAHGPDRLVYVSCSLRSMVRDLTGLVDAGYTLSEVHAVDMFPHTPHLEVVGLLSRGTG